MQKKKTEKGDPLVSPGIDVTLTKNEQLLFFSSLCQMVEFDTLKFRRTFLVSSCGLKKISIIVTFHLMKRRLKTVIKDLEI